MSLPHNELHYICFFYISKMVSSVRRCTDFMSPLCVLKVSVMTACQALKDIDLS